MSTKWLVLVADEDRTQPHYRTLRRGSIWRTREILSSFAKRKNGSFLPGETNRMRASCRMLLDIGSVGTRTWSPQEGKHHMRGENGFADLQWYSGCTDDENKVPLVGTISSCTLVKRGGQELTLNAMREVPPESSLNTG